MHLALNRNARLIVASIVLALSSVAWIPVVAGPAHASQADEFVSLINGLRASRGVAPLAVDGQLNAVAQSWAGSMAQVGTISHRNPITTGMPAGWRKCGENVAYAGSVQQAFDALVNSPGHFNNMVDPAYTHIGVGVAYNGHTLYTAHEFAALGAAPAAATPPPPAPPPPPPPATPPPPPPPPPPPTTVPPPPPTTAAPPPPTTSATTTTTTAPPDTSTVRPTATPAAAADRSESAAGTSNSASASDAGLGPVVLGGAVIVGGLALAGAATAMRIRTRG